MAAKPQHQTDQSPQNVTMAFHTFSVFPERFRIIIIIFPGFRVDCSSVMCRNHLQSNSRKLITLVKRA